LRKGEPLANAGAIQQLHAAEGALDKIVMEKLLRTPLGVGSMAAELEARLEALRRVRLLAGKYTERAHNAAFAQTASQFNTLCQLIAQQAAHADPTYLQERDQFLNQLDAHMEELRRHISSFVAAAVIERGFLEDEGIRAEA
jgi:hypothetical protein